MEQFVPTSLLKELGQRAIVTKKRWIEGKATNQELDELSDKVTNLLTDIDETICSRLILETILALLEKEPLTCAKSTANKVIVTIGQYAYEKDGWREASDAQASIFRWQKEQLDELRKLD